MSGPKDNVGSKNDWKLEGSSWAGAWKIFAGIGGVGLLASIAGYFTDPRRFAFSWMFAFITVLMVALGALFFVLVQHLTSAGWSVTVRRTAEFFSYGLLVLVPLFIPVLLTMNQLFPWLGHGEEGKEHSALQIITPAYAQESAEPKAAPAAEAKAEPAHAAAVTADAAAEPAHAAAVTADAAAPAGHATEPARHADTHAAPAADGHAAAQGAVAGGHAATAAHAHGPAGDPHEVMEKEILAKKKPYLNRTFFLVRVVFYFVVWGLLAIRFFGYSTTQDKTKDPKLTVAAQRFAPPATFLYGLTLTFAVFDWVMSLEPTWFSTIFGVVMFSTGVVSSLAVLILVTLALRTAGPLKGAVTVEHFHDLGKLMFGFLVFWAYVQFSQYMLIWYAALPEETTFYHNRWNYAPWATVSLAIIFVHFILPFFWTMSRNFKRNLGRLRIGAVIILVMHVVDIYWFVMPNFLLGKEGFTFHWLDATCLLAVAGIYGAFVFNRMNLHALVPVGDPRLQRSLEFTNA